MADNDLKPCPFCGSAAVFRPGLTETEVGCFRAFNGCSVSPSVRRASFSEAQRAWNERAN